MYRQGPQAGQEEEDQARNQDFAEHCWRAQRCCALGCCEGSSGKYRAELLVRRAVWGPDHVLTRFQSKTPSIVFEYVNVSIIRYGNALGRY